MTVPARFLLAICALLPVFSAARGETAAEFYSGKQVRMIIGHPAGGDYDLGGRLLAKYLPRYIPGKPSVTVQNLPGAASVIAANQLYNAVPKDGTVFGSFSRNLPSQAALGQANIHADPRRFSWIGASSLPAHVCIARGDAPVRQASDLFAHELIVPAAGTGSALGIIPSVINSVLGTKFRIVQGYQGFPDALLAMERGEVQGLCNVFVEITGHAELMQPGKARFLFHTEEAPIASDPGLPSIYQFAHDARQQQLLRFVFSSVEFGRPTVMPPDVPAERLAAFRAAFKAALADPDLLAEAAKSRLDMTYRSPEALTALVAQLYATPADELDIVRKLVPGGG